MAVRTAPEETQIVTRDMFYAWTKTCTVRQIHKRYEAIAEEAKKNSRSITAEMKSQGYKDFNAFNKSCPRFPLTCWPREMAELGSGVVLYFHFLALLAIVFLLISLAQIPALVVYGQSNDLKGWQFSDYGAAYSTKDPCRCLGTNHFMDGLDGLPPTANYGESCSAWDAPWHFGLDAATVAPNLRQPGRWMCRKWCWAAPHCPSPFNKEQPSLTNVHVQGLVRSYSFCADDSSEATVLQDCPGPLSADVVFNESGAHFGLEGTSIGSHWLTPGNFGPNQGTNTWIPSIYLGCVVAVAVMMLLGYQHMVITDIKVDAAVTSPNDFALMVRGLPASATDEQDIVQWFIDNALPGQKTEIVKVVIGWDVEEFRENIAEMKKCVRELQGLDQQCDEAVTLKKRILEIRSNLNSAAPDRAAKLRSSGIVVVTFRHQNDMRACLQRWNTFWGRWFYCDGVDAPICWQGNKFFKGEMLPMFPLGDTPTCRIGVERAANPGDINWTELGIPPAVKYKRLAKTNLAMGIVILITFFAVYGLNKLADWATDQKESRKGNQNESAGFQALAFLPAVLVMLMNMALQICARTLGQYEFHETKTEEMYAQATKMCVGMILNTAGVLLFLNTQPKEWYYAGGLIENTGTMLLTNALIPPFIPLLDIKYYMNFRKRQKKLTDEKLAKINEVLSRAQRAQSPDPALQKEVEQVKNQIRVIQQQAFAPSEMDSPRRYADALKTTFCCIFFSPVMPFVSFLGFIGMVLQYATDKYGLLRVYKRSAGPMNSCMAMFSMRIIKKFAPLALAIAIFIFLTPSWKDKEIVISSFISAIVIAAVNVFLPLALLGRCLQRCYSGKEAGEMDYYQAQYMWAKEMKYHKDHFLYAKMPDTVNPEYLTPGKSAAVKASDVKASYGSATQSAASVAEIGSVGQATALRGGQVVSAFSVGDDVAADGPRPSVYGVASGGGGYVPGAPPPDGGGAPGYVPGGVASTGYVPGVASGGPAPYVPGVASGGPAHVPGVASGGAPVGYVPGAAAAPVYTATASPYIPGVASTGSAPGGVVPGAPRATWEFQANSDHWHTFDKDCHDFIERKYCEYKSGSGPARFRVNTKGITLSLDVEKMTQMKADTHRVSAIRRLG